MAETFVAVRRGPAGFEQRVCLKRILPGYAGDPAFVELFLDEARLLAQLRSGNIVQVYDFGEAEGTYYMALELVEGADLLNVVRSRMRSGAGVQFPPDIAVYIIGQLLQALEYAHTASIDGKPLNIVHRDVSPSNILVSDHGEVKLTDFGIAKAHGRKHKTRTGHTKGKLAYMSPEQVRGEDLDGRSDLFAVGIVLYELLSGEHPFEADTDLGLLHNILAGKAPPLGELVPGLPPELVVWVETLMANDRDRRPPSAAAALAALPPLGNTFNSQRELAALVQACVAQRKAQEARTPTPSTPIGTQPPLGSGDLGARDGATAVLPPGKTPASQESYRPQATTRDLLTPRARRRRPAPLIAIAVLGTLAVLGVAWAWLDSREGKPDTTAAPLTSAAPTNAQDAPAAHDDKSAKLGEGRGAGATDGAVAREDVAPVAPIAPPPSEPKATATSTGGHIFNRPEGRIFNQPEATPVQRENAPREKRSSQQQRPRVAEPARTATTPPATTASPEKPRTRSGLGVSADEF